MSPQEYILIVFSVIFIIICFVVSFIIWNRIKRAGEELNNSSLENAGRLSLLILKTTGVLVLTILFFYILTLMPSNPPTCSDCYNEKLSVEDSKECSEYILSLSGEELQKWLEDCQ